MLVLETKPMDELIEQTLNFNSLLIVGCNGCTSVMQVSGGRQAETVKNLLETVFKLKGKTVKLYALGLERQCCNRLVRNALTPYIENYEGVLSLACGSGVQTVASVFEDKPVMAGCNTKFIGSHDRERAIHLEFCKACGDCLLNETGGICPVTRCAKGLLNGPCGGFSDGKCEASQWKRDCAWVLIFNRLKKFNKLDSFIKFRPPRDYRVTQTPREILEGEAFV
jgi:ribosomal protein S27E